MRAVPPRTGLRKSAAQRESARSSAGRRSSWPDSARLRSVQRPAAARACRSVQPSKTASWSSCTAYISAMNGSPVLSWRAAALTSSSHHGPSPLASGVIGLYRAGAPAIRTVVLVRGAAVVHNESRKITRPRCARRGRWGRRISSAAGRSACPYVACCTCIVRPRRCARTSSGQWPGFLACLSACLG